MPLSSARPEGLGGAGAHFPNSGCDRTLGSWLHVLGRVAKQNVSRINLA